MVTSFTKQTSYARLVNGVDVYVLRVPKSGFVVTTVALPGGAVAMRDTAGLAALFTDTFPSATKTKTQDSVKERFDDLGAQVAVSLSKEYVLFSLTTLPTTFSEALELLFEVLTEAKVSNTEWEASRMRVSAMVLESAEDTAHQANIALLRALYDKEHPHYVHTTTDMYGKLQQINKESLLHAYKDLGTGVGALVTVVGDISVTYATDAVTRVATRLHEQRQTEVKVSSDALVVSGSVHHTVAIHDKENVNTLTGIPLTTTVLDDTYLPLSVAVRALGGTSTARLFNELRTRQSLTYGAYASLDAFSKSYPGYLRTSAIFPNALFEKGRASLCALVENFCEKGITARELSEQKEELRYRHVLNLSSVRSVATALTGALLSGYDTTYLDTYLERVANLTLREVNDVVKEQVTFSLMKTAAAGSIADESKII